MIADKLATIHGRPRFALLLAAILAMTSACADDAPPRWNVVLVLVDTLRADHLGMYGYDRQTAPFLSELSRQGTIFREARSQAGCTFPAVNSLFTSQHPQIYHQTMKEHGWAIPESIPTLTEMLKSAGYATGAVSSSPIIRVNPGPQNPDGGFGAGFDRFEDDCEREPASCVNAEAFRMLDELAEPFFLYLHYFEPHDPYQPPTEHERVFATGQSDKAWVADGSIIPMYKMLYEDGPAVEFTDRDLAHTIDLYDEEILYFDSQFRSLIERLRQDGTLDRTILVFMSDHGEEFMEHDDLFHCEDLTFDTAIKMPLVLWIPGLDQPRSSTALAQTLDIVPTILDYLEIDASSYDLKGRSLRPLLEGDAAIHRYIFGIQRYSRYVTDGRFKLTYNIKTGEAKLFDLLSDPTEQIDIILRRPQLADQLTELLLGWVESVEADVDVAERVEKANKVTERLRALGYL